MKGLGKQTAGDVSTSLESNPKHSRTEDDQNKAVDKGVKRTRKYFTSNVEPSNGSFEKSLASVQRGYFKSDEVEHSTAAHPLQSSNQVCKPLIGLEFRDLNDRISLMETNSQEREKVMQLRGKSVTLTGKESKPKKSKMQKIRELLLENKELEKKNKAISRVVDAQTSRIILLESKISDLSNPSKKQEFCEATVGAEEKERLRKTEEDPKQSQTESAIMKKELVAAGKQIDNYASTISILQKEHDISYHEVERLKSGEMLDTHETQTSSRRLSNSTDEIMLVSKAVRGQNVHSTSFESKSPKSNITRLGKEEENQLGKKIPMEQEKLKRAVYSEKEAGDAREFMSKLVQSNNELKKQLKLNSKERDDHEQRHKSAIAQQNVRLAESEQKRKLLAEKVELHQVELKDLRIQLQQSKEQNSELYSMNTQNQGNYQNLLRDFKAAKEEIKTLKNQNEMIKSKNLELLGAKKRIEKVREENFYSKGLGKDEEMERQEKKQLEIFDLETIKEDHSSAAKDHEDAHSKLVATEAEALAAKESFASLQGRYDNVVNELSSLQDEITRLDEEKQKFKSQINVLTQRAEEPVLCKSCTTCNAAIKVVDGSKDSLINRRQLNGASERLKLATDGEDSRHIIADTLRMQEEIEMLRRNTLQLESDIEYGCKENQNLNFLLEEKIEECQVLMERLESMHEEGEKKRQESKLLQEKNADLVLQLSKLSEENSCVQGDEPVLQVSNEIEALNIECEKWKKDCERLFSELEARRIDIECHKKKLQGQEELQLCNDQLRNENEQLILQRDEWKAKTEALERDVKESRQILEEAAIDIDHMNQDIENLEVENEKLVLEIEELMEHKDHLMEKNMDIQFQLAGKDGQLVCIEETEQNFTSLETELEQLRMYNRKIESELEALREKATEDLETSSKLASEVAVATNRLKKESNKETEISGVEDTVAGGDNSDSLLENCQEDYGDPLDDTDKLCLSSDDVITENEFYSVERFEGEKDTVSTSPESELSIDSQRYTEEQDAKTDEHKEDEKTFSRGAQGILEEEAGGNNSNAEDNHTAVSELSDLQSQQLLLQQAMDYRNRRDTKQSSWMFFSSQRTCDSEKEEKEYDRQREDLVDKLTEANDSYQKHIMALKSEIVELNKTLKDDAYTSKKRIDVLEQENLAHQLKISALENELERLRTEVDQAKTSKSVEALEKELQAVCASKQQVDREIESTKNYLYGKQSEIQQLQNEKQDLKAQSDALENIILAINEENSTLRDIAQKATNFSFQTELGKEFQEAKKNTKIAQLERDLIELRMKGQEKLKNQAAELENEKKQIREAMESHYTLLDEEHQDVIQHSKMQLQAREEKIEQLESELARMKKLTNNT